jgi:hypothetical protein
MNMPKNETSVRPYVPKNGETFEDVARQNSEEMERAIAERKIKIAEMHNKIAGEIVASIVKPMVDIGGNGSDILLLLESVIVGTLLMTTKPEADGKILSLVLKRAELRVTETRAKVKSDNVLNAAFAH